MRRDMYTVNYDNDLVNCMEYIESIEILNDGKVSVFKSDNKYYAKIKNNLKALFRSARIMPAFGVSLHDDTVEAIKVGKWIKINYSKELEVNDLPFTSLIFELNTTQGVNLIREYNNRYDGRCIYLDFDEVIDIEKALF